MKTFLLISTLFALSFSAVLAVSAPDSVNLFPYHPERLEYFYRERAGLETAISYDTPNKNSKWFVIQALSEPWELKFFDNYHSEKGHNYTMTFFGGWTDCSRDSKKIEKTRCSEKIKKLKKCDLKATVKPTAESSGAQEFVINSLKCKPMNV